MGGGGYLEIQSNSRRDAMEPVMLVVIKGEIEENNPPNGSVKGAEMILPIRLVITNRGPPSFKFPLQDVKVTVG